MTTTGYTNIVEHAEHFNSDADIYGDNGKEEDLTILDYSVTDPIRETSIIFDWGISIGAEMKKKIAGVEWFTGKVTSIDLSREMGYHMMYCFKKTMSLN